MIENNEVFMSKQDAISSEREMTDYAHIDGQRDGCVPTEDRGSWKVHVSDSKVYVVSDDFIHDEMMQLTGDYETPAQKIVSAQAIADKLNGSAKANKSISSTLGALLKYSKSDANRSDWKALAGVLSPLYFEGMTMEDVFNVTLNAFQDMLEESRFECGCPTQKIKDLLLAPIKAGFALTPGGIDTEYAVDAFYDAMLKYILSTMRLSRVDWCVEKLAR